MSEHTTPTQNIYERVQASRRPDRPDALQFIRALVPDFIELHGDRRFADDAAVVAGLGTLNGQPVTVLALEKGENNADRLRRNFGSAQPEGYRKTLYQLRQAEKFRRPVLCFVDTAGAACGIGAEERGQGLAIAENLWELMGLHVPVISLIIGEGGSGGALALATANRVYMLDDAIYSVLSPEGAASIIWKDAGRVQEASESLRLTAQDMLDLRVIDGIVPQGQSTAGTLDAAREAMTRALTQCKAMPPERLRRERYLRFRGLGVLIS